MTKCERDVPVNLREPFEEFCKANEALHKLWEIIKTYREKDKREDKFAQRQYCHNCGLVLDPTGTSPANEIYVYAGRSYRVRHRMLTPSIYFPTGEHILELVRTEPAHCNDCCKAQP